MYKELENEYDDFKAPKHGLVGSLELRVRFEMAGLYDTFRSCYSFDRDLSSWAKQGVLLLNTSLTVRAHEANSHSKKGWETFTEKALKVVIDRLAKGAATEVDGPEGQAGQGAKGVVFLAWGAGAGKLVKGISEVSLERGEVLDERDRLTA
jgi:uracil-DNA glycosylase